MSSDFLSLEEWEIVPPPVNETPRQYLLRMTGYDFTSLEDISWGDVREHPFIMEWLTHVIAIAGKPSILVVKRRKQESE